MYIFKTNTERFQLNANYANALREADGGLYTFGNVNKPVYFNNGVPVVCNQYGGGTAITLNGTSKASSTASFYAPTGAGTSGQILSSTGSAPDWINQSAIAAGTAAKWATARTLTLTGDVTGSVSFDGSGNISLTTTVENDSHSHSNYLRLTGGTLTGQLVFDNNASNQNGYPSIKWGTIQSNTPFIGYATDQSDGTFIIASTKGTDYATGLAIGGSSQNLLFKGQIVLNASNFNQYAPSLTGSGASGTWGISISGNAATATTATSANTATNATNATNVNIAADTSSKIYVLGATTTGNTRIYRESSVYMQNNVLFGAAWNDYAEYRESNIAQPGRCIIENGDDTLRLSTERLQRGAEIVSDTFGFAIGETDTCKTPIAVSGRVLAYGYEDREQFKSHIGYPVCSGPNGTVSIMTDEEEQLYPSRIIGYISAVPDYEIWGTGNVKVDGRIWIRIK